MVALDAMTYAANPEIIDLFSQNPSFVFCRGDIRDTRLVEEILDGHRIDTVVNFAAESHVDRSIADADAFVSTNINGVYSLLKTCRKYWSVGRGHFRRFHHISTDEVYGSLENSDPPFTENSPYRPNSPYSASKAASDFLTRSFVKTYGFPATISNCSNNFGPYQHPEKLIPMTVLKLLDGHAVPVYGDGRQIRDWLHARDHCRGIDLILHHGKPGETYNIGSRNERTNLEIIGMICDCIDGVFASDPGLSGFFPRCPAAVGRRSRELIEHVADRPGHDRRYGVDNSKMVAELGFCPTESFEEQLCRTVGWYVARAQERLSVVQPESKQQDVRQSEREQPETESSESELLEIEQSERKPPEKVLSERNLPVSGQPEDRL